jgi:hypothetical protein
MHAPPQREPPAGGINQISGWRQACAFGLEDEYLESFCEAGVKGGFPETKKRRHQPAAGSSRRGLALCSALTFPTPSGAERPDYPIADDTS